MHVDGWRLPPLAALLSLTVLPAATGRAAFNVTWWDLLTLVRYSGANFEQDFESTDVVQNPLVLAQAAALHGSTAETSYNFGWTGNSGTFRVDGAHVAENTASANVYSLSQGSIRFTTDTDLRAEVRGVYDWSMPVYGTVVVMTFRLWDRRTPQLLYLRAEASEDTFQSWPLAGRFDVSDTGIIPAGCDCQLRYAMQLANSAGIGPPTTGAGSFVLTLQPVPEPATALLLAPPVLAYAARRRARPCRRGRIRVPHL